MKKTVSSVQKPKTRNTLLNEIEIINRIGFPVIAFDKEIELVILNQKAVKLFGKIDSSSDFFKLFEKSTSFLNACKKAKQLNAEKVIEVAFSKKQKMFEIRIFPSPTGVTLLMEEAKPEIRKLSELEQISLLSESMGDSFLLTDEQLNILDVNNAFCKSIGYSKNQLLGMKSTDLDRGLSAKEIKAYYKKADKGAITFDTQNINSKGACIDVEVNLFCIHLDGKKYYASIGRDITLFKEAQKELKTSNERFEIISNSTQDALWEVNYLTGEKWGNDIHQKLYGKKKGDPVPESSSWEGRIHPADRKRILAMQASAINNRRSNLNCEYWFKVNKGKWIFVYDRTHYVYDVNGKLIQAMGSMLDFTALKEIQEQLTNQKNLSESIINALPGIFFLMDKKSGKLTRWNKNLETVMGYSAEEIKNMKTDLFFTEEQKPLLQQKISEVFQRGWTEMETTLVTKRQEKKPYYLTGWRTIVENEECLIGTGIDMTELKKAETRVKQMERKIAGQKIQEQMKISRAIIAAQEKERNHIGRELHDNVNQLLAGTRLYLTMGAKKDPHFQEIAKYPIELLDSGINEIRSLTHQHISPSKEAGLKQLAETQIQFLKAASIEATLNYDLQANISQDLKTNLYRILQEQVNNIIKHSEAKNVSISMCSKDCSIVLKTEDDGKGFNTDVVRDGIGISNITNRVNAYDGKMSIESEPGRGCQIHIQIPVPDCEDEN